MRYHLRCAAPVALSRDAMSCEIWSGKSLPPDLCCAACGRALAPPLPVFSDETEPPSGAWRHAAVTRIDRHAVTAPWSVERRARLPVLPEKR